MKSIFKLTHYQVSLTNDFVCFSDEESKNDGTSTGSGLIVVLILPLVVIASLTKITTHSLQHH